MPSYSKQFIDIAPNGIPAKVGFSGTIASTADSTIYFNSSGTQTASPNWTYTEEVTFKELNPVTLHTVPAGAKDEIHLFMGFKRIMSFDFLNRYAVVVGDYGLGNSVLTNSASIDSMPDVTMMAIGVPEANNQMLINLKDVVMSDVGSWMYYDALPGIGGSTVHLLEKISDLPLTNSTNWGGDFTLKSKVDQNNGIHSNSSWISLSAGNEKIPLRISGAEFVNSAGGVPMHGQKILNGMLLNSNQSLKLTLRHFHVARNSTSKCFPSGIFRAYFWGYVNRIS